MSYAIVIVWVLPESYAGWDPGLDHYSSRALSLDERHGCCFLLVSSLGLLSHLRLLNNEPTFKFISKSLQFLKCFLCDCNSVLFHSCMRVWGKRAPWASDITWGKERRVYIPEGQSLRERAGPQAQWQPHSQKPFWLKPTLSDSSVTFTTFRSHRWLFWKRLRQDPFQKEEGRRDGKPTAHERITFWD